VEVLDELQKRFLQAARSTPLAEHFVLAGGAALGGVYLKHRRTGDLDFFTREAAAVRSAVPVLQEIAAKLGLAVDIRRLQGTFFQAFLAGEPGTLKIDVAHDTPFRLAEPKLDSELGFPVESIDDLVANKVSALFDRAEPRDFVDIYFLAQDYAPFPSLVEKAKQKHLGIDDYWLAQALGRVDEPVLLPDLIRPVTLETLRDFFHERIVELVPPTP